MRSNGLAIGLCLLIGAFFVVAAGVGQGKEDAPEHGKTKKTTSHESSDHKEPHKLTAEDEVSDQTKDWYLFHEFGIKLPLVGWWEIAGYRVPTKYMWLILIAACLIAVIYINLARRVASGAPVAGPFWNAFESLLTFIRDEVAKPNFPEHTGHHNDHATGHHHAAHEPTHGHPADQYVPFLWTIFLFVLFCNVLGIFPFMGSPTANIYMTGGLAVIAFIVIHGAAIAKVGLLPYLKSQWPPFELAWPMAIIIKPMIFIIEMLGTVIKSGVLAIRLFANMFAGHMVLASILLFIVVTRNSSLWGVVTTASVLGVIALSLLELFVAFLQAYIFVFLTALFMGMALNPQH